jgi:hypothetical protein
VNQLIPLSYTPVMWQTDLLTHAIADALEAEEHRLAIEQAVYGLDALSEVEFHPIIARGASQHAAKVLREVEYPHHWRARGSAAATETDESREADEPDALPHRRDRLRCDLVLLPTSDAHPHVEPTLADPVKRIRTRRAARAEVVGTLFESLSPGAAVADESAPNRAIIEPEDAFWLEIKLVAQHCFTSGVPGPNNAYSSELLRGVPADIAKLAGDRQIVHAAAALIHLTTDEATAEHDLVALLHRCLDRGLDILSPCTRRFAITDRIGNRTCSVSVIGVRRS